LFVDAELRQQVQKLAFRPKNDQAGVAAAKRRKLGDDQPSLLLELAGQMCRLVDVHSDSPMDELESRMMFVTPGCLTVLN
jgi:serine/threonine-protein kinase ATR